jgi:hypothetical protein
MKLETLKDETSTIWGMIAYDIVIDDNSGHNKVLLNGLWTNNVIQSRIMNEVARQRIAIETINSDFLSGEYNCAFIEVNRIENNATETMTIVTNLKIMLQTNQSYELIWSIEGHNSFQGIGFRLNNRLIVTYWEV